MSGSVSRFRRTKSAAVGAVAGNGLMDRRALLRRGVVLAGAMSTAPLGALTGAAAEPSTDTPLTDAPWSLERPFSPTSNRRGSRKASYAV